MTSHLNYQLQTKTTMALCLLLLLSGCASPYVVGIAKTNKYLSGVYDVTDTQLWGVGTIGGPYGGGVVGYNHTLVRTIATGAVYGTVMQLKEAELLGGSR